MGEGDEISDVAREEAAREGHSTAHRHRGPLQRYIDKKLDVAVYMFGRLLDRPRWQEDPLEETPEAELLKLEEERKVLRESDESKDS